LVFITHYNINWTYPFGLTGAILFFSCSFVFLVLICIHRNTNKKDTTMTTEQEFEYLLKTIKENNEKIAAKHKQIKEHLAALEKSMTS